MSQTQEDSIEALLRKQFDGPISDEGFSQHVMAQVPQRRRRIAWPLWSSVLVGAVLCWLTLWSSPLLRTSWQNWESGHWSASATSFLLAMFGMAVLALAWSVTEADDR